MARHRSPRGRGTYPAPPQTAPRRHAAGRGARRSVQASAGGGRHFDSSVALPFAAPIDVVPTGRPLVVRLPTQRAAPEALVGTAPEALEHAAPEALENTAPEAFRRPEPQPAEQPAAPPVPQESGRTGSAARRFGAAAVVAAASGAISLVATAIPGDTFAGGYGIAPVLALDAAVSDQQQPEQQGIVDAAPAAAVGGRLAAVELVGPEPLVASAAELVAAVQKAQTQVAAAEQQRIAAEQQAAAAAKARTRECGLDESGLGAVKSHVQVAAELLGCRFGEPTMYGVAGRAGTSDHPHGKAVDFMVDRKTGDALAACALRNQEALGITYVIWRQRINMGSGWEAMEDRGSVTANHFDHVHVSFGNGASGDSLAGCA